MRFLPLCYSNMAHIVYLHRLSFPLFSRDVAELEWPPCTESVGYVCVSGQAVDVVAEALMG